MIWQKNCSGTVLTERLKQEGVIKRMFCTAVMGLMCRTFHGLGADYLARWLGRWEKGDDFIAVMLKSSWAEGSRCCLPLGWENRGVLFGGDLGVLREIKGVLFVGNPGARESQREPDWGSAVMEVNVPTNVRVSKPNIKLSKVNTLIGVATMNTDRCWQAKEVLYGTPNHIRCVFHLSVPGFIPSPIRACPTAQ